MIPRDSLPPSSDCALDKLSKGVTALKKLAQRPDKELQATTATSTGLEAKLAGEVKEQEGGHVSRKWLSRAASVTSFVSAPAVIGVLGLVLLQPLSGPRLLGPTHAGETAAQAATTMPYRVGGRGLAGVEGGLYAEGTSKRDSKALAADLPAAAAESPGTHSEAIPKVEAIAAVPESERATNLPVRSRSSEVSSSATMESFPDIPLPPTKVAEPSALFAAELAKQKQAQMHAVAREQRLQPVVHKASPGAKALESKIGSATPGNGKPASPSTDLSVREQRPVTIADPLRVAPSPTKSGQDAESSAQPLTRNTVAVEAQQRGRSQEPFGSVNTDRLVARAESLVGQGDISAARLLLEPAVDAGSARAAFLLAQTYDPGVLGSRRVRGISGDDAKARSLYTRAYQGGILQARERVEAMR